MIAVLGAFDGFHRGHAALFGRARDEALARGLEWGGVTFASHPGLHMGTVKNLLFTQRERELVRIFLGIPKLVGLTFDDDLSRLAPPRFWEYLRERVPVDGIVVGRDFRFGYRRIGDALLLERYCREAGKFFLALDLLESLGVKISSSSIRGKVEAGQCEPAAKELGYPYFMMAQVVHGLERGRKLGFPTANMEVPAVKTIPSDGVYAVAVLVRGVWKAGALSIGKNPTFDDVPDVRVEVFVLDYEGDLYDENLLIFFLSRLRPQAQFKSAEQLVLQIGADVERARGAFKRSFEASPDSYFGFIAAHAKLTAMTRGDA
jgi:riboflavin kinase/FMN adenylyltransferase